MFTKLKNQTDSNQAHSNRSHKTHKTNVQQKDKEWIKGLAQTPIISKSLILPRYMQTKEELIEELLELPYKGVLIEKESTCSEKQSRVSSQYVEESSTYWFINQFMKSNRKEKRNQYWKSQRETKQEVKTKRLNQQMGFKNVPNSTINVQKQFNKRSILDQFIKDIHREQSDIISHQGSQISKQSQNYTVYQLQNQNKYNPNSNPNFKKQKSMNQNSSLKYPPTISSIVNTKQTKHYSTQAIQTNFKDQQQSVQCTIVKQRDQDNQYSYQYPSETELNISEIKREQQQSQGSLSIKNSIKQIESSIEERKSIKPIKIVENKSEKKEFVKLTEKKDTKNIGQELETRKKQKTETQQFNKSKDNKSSVPIIEKPQMNQKKQQVMPKEKKDTKPNILEKQDSFTKKNPSQLQNEKVQSDTKNVLKIDLIKKAEDRNHQKLIEQKQKRISEESSRVKQHKSQKSQEDSLQEIKQAQPIKKEIDLVEEKKKRDKLLKIQEDTNKKLFNIFENNNKAGSNTESPSQTQGIHSKLTQKKASSNQHPTHPNPKKQKIVEQPKSHLSSNKSGVSFSNMQSFYTQNMSKRGYSDFPDYTVHQNELHQSQSEDFDSFQNYQSSAGTNRQYQLEQVKEEQNQESLANSKIKSFEKKNSKPQLKSTKQTNQNQRMVMNKMQIPYSSKISQEKSDEIQHSIVHQYPLHSNSNSHHSNPPNPTPSQSNIQTLSNKLPKSQLQLNNSQSHHSNKSNSFDLQQFIIKDIKNNIDELKSKMSNNVSSSSNNKSVMNAFEQFNKQLKYSELKNDIDSLKDKMSHHNL